MSALYCLSTIHGVRASPVFDKTIVLQLETLVELVVSPCYSYNGSSIIEDKAGLSV